MKEKKKKLKKEGIYFQLLVNTRKFSKTFFGKRYYKKGGGEKMLGFELVYTHESVWTVELHV